MGLGALSPKLIGEIIVFLPPDEQISFGAAKQGRFSKFNAGMRVWCVCVWCWSYVCVVCVVCVWCGRGVGVVWEWEVRGRARAYA